MQLIKQGAVKVAELVSVGSNKEMHLTDTLSICFKSGLIPRAVKAGDWQILLQQLRDQDVQALIRREAELFERDLLYVVDGWTAADLPFLAKLKDVDMETYNNTFELLSEGHLDQQAFRDIVSISPSWLGRGSESMYELGVLSAELIQGVSLPGVTRVFPNTYLCVNMLVRFVDWPVPREGTTTSLPDGLPELHGHRSDIQPLDGSN